jgi:hypothetical protein
MALHLTKVAYGASSYEDMQGWFIERGDEILLTTRYLPKRHAEIAGGSLFWILRHQLVARSPILRFAEAEQGKTHIVIAAKLIEVHPRPKRAHQGWRYLAGEDAPRDLAAGETLDDLMPGKLAGELARLGLV